MTTREKKEEEQGKERPTRAHHQFHVEKGLNELKLFRWCTSTTDSKMVRKVKSSQLEKRRRKEEFLRKRN